MRAAAAVAAGVGAAVAASLLWDDAWAPGYDGGYYVLQVRSHADGAPLFADPSWLYPVLGALVRAGADVVGTNKVAACLAAAVTAAAGAVYGSRAGLSARAAWITGLWWATSPLHLGVTNEYLKNAVGLSIVALQLAVQAGPASRAASAGALLLLGLSVGVHKLCGVLSVGLFLMWVLQRQWPGATRLGVATLGVGALLAPFAALRGVDLGRQFNLALPLDRAVLWGPTLSVTERLEVTLLYLAPAAAAVWAWRSKSREWGSLAGLALVLVAPGLAFGFDELAWRLNLMGFLPLGAMAGLALARAPRAAVWTLGALLLLQAPQAATDQAAREPDYEAWRGALGSIQATVPSGHRVVAGQGICGFIWAAGGVRCENFQPPEPWEEWWRVVYGVGAARLAPYAATPPVPLLPGYVLVRETEWQAFRTANLGRLPVLASPLNPATPRPDYVFAPPPP